MSAPRSLDPTQDSVSFKDTLKANRSSSGFQLYSVQNYREPCKVNWFLDTQIATTVDCRGSQYNTVAPCPTVHPTTIRKLFRKHWGGPRKTPLQVEEDFITSPHAHPAIYASDIQLIDIPDPVGNRFATLLDAPMPISDNFYQVQVGPTCTLCSTLIIIALMIPFPQGPKNSFCCYAPTAIAASDEGLGAQGYMDPGIASAVGIISSTFTTARLHAEDGFLGSANLLVKGAPKVGSRGLCAGMQAYTCM